MAVVPAAKKARTAEKPPAPMTAAGDNRMLSALVTSTTRERPQAFNAVHAVYHMHYYVHDQPVRDGSLDR
jgi:hypothetical protein